MKLTALRLTVTSQITGDVLYEYIWDKVKVKNVQEAHTLYRSQVTSSLLAVLSQMGKELDSATVQYAKFNNRQVTSKESANYTGQVSALHKRQKSTKRGLNYSSPGKNGQNLVMFETSLDGLYAGLYLRCGNDDMFDNTSELYGKVYELISILVQQFVNDYGKLIGELPKVIPEKRSQQDADQYIQFAQQVSDDGQFDKYVSSKISQFYQDNVVLLQLPAKKNQQYGTATSNMTEVQLSE